MFKSRFRQYGYESSRLRRLSPTTNVTLTNLVTNGDFSDGTTGWTASNGTGEVVENTYRHTGNGATSYPYVRSTLPSSVIDRVYAATLRFRVTTTDCLRLVWQFGNGTSLNQPQQVTSPVQNTWYPRTFVYTATSATTTLSIAHIYTDAATANGKVMEVQYVSCVDLTDAFGAGNEPTTGEMNSYMAQFDNNWFNGSVVISV